MHPFMAATPEEVLGFVRPTSPPPSIFLDLPPTPHQQPAQNLHMALDSISRMLMEEDIVEKIMYQYPENPILLQAQQPFAQILSGAPDITSPNGQESLAPIMLSSALLPSQPSTMNLQDRDLDTSSLNGMDSISSPVEGHTGMQMLSAMAFLKRMEEARFLLSGADSEMLACKKRFHEEDGDARDSVGRIRKQIMIPVQDESDEEATARNLLDQLMLEDHGLCSSAMQKLRVMTGEVIKQQNICVQVPRMKSGMKQMFVVDLETLLLHCAEAVATNDRHNAGKFLEKIKRHSSPMGATTERLAHYFAEGLEARLAGKGSQLYHSLLMMKHSTILELVKAYKLYVDVSCSTKVAFLFCNKTIYNVAAGKNKLHIVHYGIGDGLQWTELLQWFAEREEGPPEVRITGINSWSQPAAFHPAKRTEEAGRRLILCASKLGVPFKFRAITAKFETVCTEDLDINPDEVLIVNSIFQFRNLMDETLTADRINPKDQVLNTIRKMKPAVFIHGVVNASYCAASFVTRFRHALYNFTAAFDLMETTVPRDNDLRLVVERDIFARSAMNIIACEGADRVERTQHYKEWHVRNQRAGLRQLPLDPEIVRVLKAQVKKRRQKNFMINEDHHWLLQGWKGRVLTALSIWAANDVSSSHSIES
ncbi:scarecrow-like protein 9 [Lolium perenne]|uniref:scarecrow-like protein 9 n=1 Tax=Lolium perenne TaxID=4522 RepID=UPI0021F57299|nr:scarecrow-like protein 33 [Lolium perenne]